MSKFKISNWSGLDVIMDWTIDLFDSPTMIDWKKYVESPDFKGDSPESVAANLRKPIAYKVQEFANRSRLGIPVETMVADQFGGRMVVQYKFKFPKDKIMLFNERQVEHFRPLERKVIEQALKPGQTEPDVHYEGFYTIEEVDNDYKLEKELVDIPYKSMDLPKLKRMILQRKLQVEPGSPKSSYVKVLQDDDEHLRGLRA